MIQSLEGKGLIKRVQNPEDKRSMYVELTEVGAGVSEKCSMNFKLVLKICRSF